MHQSTKVHLQLDHSPPTTALCISEDHQHFLWAWDKKSVLHKSSDLSHIDLPPLLLPLPPIPLPPAPFTENSHAAFD